MGGVEAVRGVRRHRWQERHREREVDLGKHMEILYDGDEALTIGVCGPGDELTAVVWGFERRTGLLSEHKSRSAVKKARSKAQLRTSLY